jgi:hypothetical protein
VLIVLAVLGSLVGNGAGGPSASQPEPTSEATDQTQAPESEAAPSTAPTATPAAEQPTTITGSGISNSAPFPLEGDYLVEWTATSIERRRVLPRREPGLDRGFHIRDPS